MRTARTVRLEHDYLAMQALQSDIIKWEADRRIPPEIYAVDFTLRGMIGPDSFRETHTVVIKLLPEYPDRPPLAKFTSRPLLYHPHVFGNGVVCVGGYSPDEGLAVFCLRLAKYIQFQPYLINTKSPANKEALQWFEQNRDKLPVDNTPLPDVASEASF